jgi:MFS family permease
METAKEKETGYIGLIKNNGDFQRLWLGQIVSQTGDWFNTIALYAVVLKLTGSGKAIGLLLVARFLPTVFCGSTAGVIADRFSRKTIMIVTDLLRAVIVLGFLLVRRADQMWIVYLLTVLQLTTSTFFEPARTAAIPSVVHERDLVTANAITSATWSTVLTLGAALGGFVAGWFGTDAAFVIDSASYFLSAILIATIHLPKREKRPKSKLTIAKALGITDTLEGFRYVRERPRIFAAMLAKPFWGIGGGSLAMLAVFGEKVFPIGGTATGIGLLFTARGIGTAIGPIVLRRFVVQTRENLQRYIGLSFILGSLFYMMFGIATVYAIAIFGLLAAHSFGSIMWVNSTVLLQSSVEDNFRGRVFAAELALLTLTLAASNYATGELLDTFNLSPRTVAAIIGAIWLLPGFLWFATQRFWNKEILPIADCQLPIDSVSDNYSAIETEGNK